MKTRPSKPAWRCWGLGLIVCAIWGIGLGAQAQTAGQYADKPLGQHWGERFVRRGAGHERMGEGRGARAAAAQSTAALPAGVEKIADMAYGQDERERLDVYRPSNAGSTPAPVIFMVHGGGWRVGDKAAASVVQNKVARWVPRGFILISVNYPLLPKASVAHQAQAVAKALAYAQQHAKDWGGAADQFILMGHSAGAHLVALLNAKPAYAQHLGAQAWLGTVALDSAMLDTTAVMQQRHLPLYDQAFGSDPSYWQAMSPYAQLTPHALPYLLVCSSLRSNSCPQAQAMAEHMRSLRGQAQVLPQALEHGQINAQLGLDTAYTKAVEAAMASWSLIVAKTLGN